MSSRRDDNLLKADFRSRRAHHKRIVPPPVSDDDREFETADEPENVDEPENAGDGRAKARRRRSGRAGRVFLRLVLVALILAAGFWAWQNKDSLSPEGIKGKIEAAIAGKDAGTGYPVEFDGNTVRDLQSFHNQPLLLTDTATVLLNDNGGEVFRRPCSYSKPVMRTAGNYVLVSELGGMRFQLGTKDSVLLDVTPDNLTSDQNKMKILDEPISHAIVAGCVNNSGMVAFATESSKSHISEVIVYSPKGKKLFQKLNASLLAVDVALSPDGHAVAFTGIQAVNGKMTSTVEVYSVKTAQLIRKYEWQDTMLCALNFYSNGKLAAIGDTGCLTANLASATPVYQNYPQGEMISYRFGTNSCAVVLQEYGASDGGKIIQIGSEGTQTAETEFEDSFRHCAFDNEKLLVLTASHLRTFNPDGTVFKQEDMTNDGRYVCPMGKKKAILTLSELRCQP